MFRQLSKREESQFKQWARANYIPHTEINPVWHPVVQSECRRINEEIGINPGEFRNKTLADKSLEIK